MQPFILLLCLSEAGSEKADSFLLFSFLRMKGHQTSQESGWAHSELSQKLKRRHCVLEDGGWGPESRRNGCLSTSVVHCVAVCWCWNKSQLLVTDYLLLLYSSNCSIIRVKLKGFICNLGHWSCLPFPHFTDPLSTSRMHHPLFLHGRFSVLGQLVIVFFSCFARRALWMPGSFDPVVLHLWVKQPPRGRII